MNEEYKKILSLYEDFKLNMGTLFGKEGFFKYQAPASLHSNVTSFAYGIREIKDCISLKNSECESRIIIDKNDLKRRFYIKLKAQLFDWEKYVIPIKIYINGILAYENDNEFFETVNLGWPTIYIPVKSELLTEGENILTIRQSECDTYLLVASLDLVSLPEIKKTQQISVKTAVRMGEIFSISFYMPENDVKVLQSDNCETIEILRSPINAEHIIVRLRALGEKPLLKLQLGDEIKSAVMPEVFPADTDVCFVGTDSDDHRHDASDETERIIEIFTNTNLGNYWQARPQVERNYHILPNESIWKRRVDYLKAFDTRLSLSDGENVMPYFAELCGENFVGKHFHEAYLFFCAALKDNEYFKNTLYIDIDALEKSESFGESKNLFLNALKKMYLSSKTGKGMASVGSPSLLVVYEANSGFERVTIEPVSNINLLIGAVRGASVPKWGAHVPTDWYFGEPNDLVKAKKYLLAMKLLYLSGADYIYAENSLFKTNAFSREDWEDDFCSNCRKYLREFYDYTVKNPRKGTLKKNFAVIYGNNEYFMWHYDDRIAELGENDDWDITLWGKWKDNSHHKCWRAIDAWLPLSENQKTRENILNPKLFSGTPYGQVDIIAYDGDYSPYKALVLLGWNTYSDGFDEKIKTYVENGGTAFVSYCHFNKTDRNDRDMEYADTGVLEMKCKEIIESSDGLRLVKCEANDAEVIFSDNAGNPLVLKQKIGEGTLFFATFADYSCPEFKLSVLKKVLEIIGQEVAEIVCTNPNVFFAERRTENGETIIDVLNMCPSGNKDEEYELVFKDNTKIKGKLSSCEIKTHKLNDRREKYAL